MWAAPKGECDGSGVIHKGGVGIMGGLGARSLMQDVLWMWVELQ